MALLPPTFYPDRKVPQRKTGLETTYQPVWINSMSAVFPSFCLINSNAVLLPKNVITCQLLDHLSYSHAHMVLLCFVFCFFMGVHWTKGCVSQWESRACCHECQQSHIFWSHDGRGEVYFPGGCVIIGSTLKQKRSVGVTVHWGSVARQEMRDGRMLFIYLRGLCWEGPGWLSVSFIRYSWVYHEKLFYYSSAGNGSLCMFDWAF